MENLQAVITEQIKNTKVGEPVIIEFSGIPMSVDIRMEFIGGWTINQTIIPGNEFSFIRGEDQYLKSITITFNHNQGLK